MALPPSTEQFGTRFFVFLLTKMLAEYLRRKIKVDLDLPPGVVTALETLITALPDLLDLNPPGPE